MRPQSSQRVGRQTSVAARARAPFVAAVAATLLILSLSFSPGARGGGGGIGTASGPCPEQVLHNGSFEAPAEAPTANPLEWSTNQWLPNAQFSREAGGARPGGRNVAKITAASANDAWFSQEVIVEPETFYQFTGWIKTENVVGEGANLSLVGTWTHTAGLSGTKDWTYVSVTFNTGASTRVTVGARLGYWAALSSGTAWFDDLRLTRLRTDGAHPRWKILVLIYDRTDAVVTDTAGVRHHMVGAMTPAEVERATLAATQFVETDIPALTSGNMIPELTIRYPSRPLTQLDPFGQAWWPSPANTAPERDAAFDSVIVIWDPRVVDQYTGVRYWIGGGAGLTVPTGVGQTYATIIIEATGYGHRNVFKHEWGHSILFYFDAAGTAPRPTVTNHAEVNQYVHWPTGENYVWVDETDANPIPNSIYHNASGFTHDYYSGATATAEQPTRRLGITPEAWALGGPVTKPGRPPTAPAISCLENVNVGNDPGGCSADVALAPAAVFDVCEGDDLRPTAARSDGLPLDAPYPCGQTVVTWSVTDSENLTSSCQQLVTVNDVERPEFVYAPPPVTVRTGADAAACGVVVSDADLRSTSPSVDPVVPDPPFDTSAPESAPRNDITSVSATFDTQSLTFTVSFAEQVFPASSTHPRALTGFIELDTDQDASTGTPPILNYLTEPPAGLGVEFDIDVGSESVHPGLVKVRAKGQTIREIGRVPIVFSGASISVAVPLVLLGGDNGLVNYGASMGAVGQDRTDRVPNGSVPPTSAPVSGLMASDNCSGVNVSRSGVPAGNLFPVGETLVTYTATDARGNAAALTQTVTVIDDTPPVIKGAAANPPTLWPPNLKMVDVTVSYEATDNCALLETSLSVASNERAGGAGPDWEVLDAHHVRLRAARTGRWGARVYTITINAKDVHGNSSSRVVAVSVQHSYGKGSPKVMWAVQEQGARAAPQPRRILPPRVGGEGRLRARVAGEQW